MCVDRHTQPEPVESEKITESVRAPSQSVLIVLLLSATLVAACGDSGGGDPPPIVIDGTVITPTGVIELFNGNSLDGLYTWLKSTGYDDPTDVFRIENNLLRITGNGIGEVITTNRYRDYHLILEFRWGNNTFSPRANKARDSGLLIHGNGEDGGAQDGKWLSSLQSQMIEGGMGDLIIVQGVDVNGNLLPQSINVETESVTCVHNNWACWYGPPTTYRWKDGASSLTFADWDLIHTGNWDPAWQDIKGFRGVNTLENPNGNWNQMVVIADGDTVEVYFNGTKVNEATKVFPTSGRIQLQSEWAELFVRRWELWPIGQAPAPINPDPDSPPVAVNGYTAGISAHVPSNIDTGLPLGATYVFDGTGATGTVNEVAKLLPSEGAEGDIFSVSVAVGGNTAVIGAPGDDDNGDNSGSAYVFDVAPSNDVNIDIQPGKTPNAIYPISMQKIPIAIITTDTFDAIQVDFETVEFGPNGATESRGRSQVKDVDEDGDIDLLLHFKTQDTGIVCGDTEATLTGETFGGEPIIGTDSIITVPCP